MRCCDGKRKLFTMKMALKAKGRMERAQGKRFNAYQCPGCGFFHVGHAR